MVFLYFSIEIKWKSENGSIFHIPTTGSILIFHTWIGLVSAKPGYIDTCHMSLVFVLIFFLFGDQYIESLPNYR